MKVAIDARFLGPHGKGLGRYVEKLLAHLAPIAAGHEFFILLNEHNWRHWQPPNQSWHRVRAPWRWYTLSEQLYLPRLLRQLKVDLVHFPHFNVPIAYVQPFVVTVHDLILWHFPTERASTLEPVYFWLKHAAYRLVIRLAVKRARRVLTVSQFSRDELVKEFGIKPTKITVTYEAVDTKRPVSALDVNRVCHRLGISRRYFLYVGNAYPHKNIERLLEAFAQLQRQDFPFQLVLVGKLDYFYQRVRRNAEAVGLLRSQHVIFPGFVSDEDLAALYAGSFAYVFPSKAEGFGLPPLEAMQYGVPVLSSDATCLPEVLGGAALFFDPSSATSIAQALQRVVADATLRQRLQQLGPAHVNRYSWPRLAEQTLAVYRSVVQS